MTTEIPQPPPEGGDELFGALTDLTERVERAREIHSDRGDWGMLDTSRARAAIDSFEGGQKPVAPPPPPPKRNPYERGRQIRRGEVDDEMPSYDEMHGWFQRVPSTVLPGFLRRIVHACVQRGVFQDGKLLTFVGECEQMAKDPNSILRSGSDQ